MYVVCVTIHVTSGHEEDFIQATRKNHRGTLLEPGALRFDVLRHEEEPGRFFLYEVYRDREAFAAHQRTDHYFQWRDTVAPWMAQPRQGIKHLSLLPGDEEGVWGSRS